LLGVDPAAPIFWTVAAGEIVVLACSGAGLPIPDIRRNPTEQKLATSTRFIRKKKGWLLM
jgi:hypothetical protein